MGANHEQSKASKRRQLIRGSEETKQFRKQIITLLQHADDDVVYSIKRDLKTMTHMPFYGEKVFRIKSDKTRIEMIKAYAKLLSRSNDITFVTRLLRELNRQQNQTLRKTAKRNGARKDIWEHVIPSKVIVDAIIDMLSSGDLQNIDRLLTLYAKAGQRALTHEENRKLKEYHNKMPDGWNWMDPEADIFARYKAVGIEIDDK